MKYILSVLLTFFSVYAFGQGSPTGAKTQFKNGVALGSKDSTSFLTNDSLFLTIDRNSKLMWRNNGASGAWNVAARLNDTLSDTRWVRLQTAAAAFQQVGKIRISDTIRTSGVFFGSMAFLSQATANLNTIRAAGGSDTPIIRIINQQVAQNGDIASFENASGDALIINNDGALQQFNQESGFWGRTIPATLTDNRNYLLPNASGTIALTSNVTDSASALRSSINTKLNISDTAAMLANRLKISDTATMLAPFVQYSDTANMLSGYARSGQYVPYTGATTNVNLGSNTITAGGAILTGAFTSSVNTNADFPNIIANTSSGTVAFTSIYSSNDGTGAGAISLGVTGTGNTVGGLFVQDAGLLLTGTDLSGGLSFGTRANATARMYTNGTLAQTWNTDQTTTLSSLGTGTVYSNSGTLTNVDPSDRRIKNTIQPHKYGLAEILKLEPKSFYYNSDSAKKHLKYSFIAQDVQKIMPDMVRPVTEGSDTLGIETQGIYTTMVKAIQEQQQQIEAQSQKITALEARIAKLESVLGVSMRKTRTVKAK